MDKKTEITRGLLKNPKSEKWRAEYSKLSAEDRRDVRYAISMEEMGTGISPEDFRSFWNYVKSRK